MIKLKNEIKILRDAGHDFLNGKITSQQFKAISGGMGVYAERGGKTFMIRLRIPSGIISYEAFSLIYAFAKKYDLPSVHFTTRQAIQLHGLAIDAVCDIMEEGIDHGIYTRGGGGNFPRNVALSPLSGVDKCEAFDPTDFALLVTKHFMSKITTYKLPRKLKVAFSNNDCDTANCSVTDLGFIATSKDNKPYFKVYIGGGLGSNPKKAVLYPELISPKDVLYHIEAITNLFIQHGDYENKAKARIRYILDRMGENDFIDCYNKYLDLAKECENLAQLDVSKVFSQEEKAQWQDGLIEEKGNESFTYSIHPLSGILAIEDFKELVEFLKKHKKLDLRLSMSESLYVRNLSKNEALKLIDLTKSYNITIPFYKSVTCIGVPTCQMGIGNCHNLISLLVEKLDKENIKFLPKLHISGCNNSCSRHQVSDIGLSGRIKKVDGVSKEAFEIYVGGSLGNNTTELGISMGTILTENLVEFFNEMGKKCANKDAKFKDWQNKYPSEFSNLLSQFTI